VANLLFHRNGSLLLRAITSDQYARIWNYEVAERLMGLESQGWSPAGVDIRAKASNESSESLDLYASDHDMFVFLCNPNLTVDERGSDGAVYKGLIVENSEVGASSLRVTYFLYREKCGNHIIWGARDVSEVNVRHVGNARYRWDRFAVQLRKYADESVSDIEAKIAKSQSRIIAATKDEVLNTLFGMRALGLSRKTLELGYDAVNVAQDGERNTQWAMVQGLTRYSQTIPYADKRTEIDKAAGKLMEMEF